MQPQAKFDPVICQSATEYLSHETTVAEHVFYEKFQLDQLGLGIALGLSANRSCGDSVTNACEGPDSSGLRIGIAAEVGGRLMDCRRGDVYCGDLSACPDLTERVGAGGERENFVIQSEQAFVTT
ncbi:hypothetical protein HPB51_008671 [Rhipicephalus microplus]|uniref:Uncharacterized protein n=1 Tax=Rhipicephalus microplus TaxID=6941 RepID=A0A9J6E8B1_RHIMP|nr:hypothetical protein HPB51_008671 [Rhipicephalus microplus]